jgi:hypothetical protein
MATNTAGTNARDIVTQQTHYLRKRLLGSGGSATYSLGFVPAGANILRISTLVRVVFNAGTIALGTAGSTAAFFAANGTPVTTLGRNSIALIASAAVGIDVDTELVAVIAGGPASGTLDVEVEFTINNDK